MFTAMPQGVNPTSASLHAIEAAALQLLHAVRSAGEGCFVSASPLPNGVHYLTVAELFNEFLVSKARAGRSDNYTGLLLKALRSFCTGREQRAVASITAREIEDWLYENTWASRTRKGRLMTQRNVFAWSVTRGELAANVAAGTDLPTDDSEGDPPGILAPAVQGGDGQPGTSPPEFPRPNMSG